MCLMTKAVKNKLLNHLNFLSSIGYTYSQPLKLHNVNPLDVSLPNNYEVLRSMALNCNLCELSKSRTNVVFGDGNINADIMFIGESPAASEDELAKFYVGKSGQLLVKMIENVLNISVNDVYITNNVKCKPSNTKTATPNEVKICKPYLDKQIEIIQPKLIVALGDLSYRHFTADSADFSQIRGKVTKYNNIDVIATFHPSFLLRNPSAKKEAYHDMLKIKSIMESF